MNRLINLRRWASKFGKPLHTINDEYMIKYFEPGTSKRHERIEAAVKVAKADYPLGFIIAPIYLHEDGMRGTEIC
jgi:DNA repair photolyase